MSTIKTVATGLHHSSGHRGTATGLVAKSQAVKQGVPGVSLASPIGSESTVVKLGAASLAPLTYDASLSRSVEHLRGGIAQYLGHGA